MKRALHRALRHLLEQQRAASRLGAARAADDFKPLADLDADILGLERGHGADVGEVKVTQEAALAARHGLERPRRHQLRSYPRRSELGAVALAAGEVTLDRIVVELRAHL